MKKLSNKNKCSVYTVLFIALIIVGLFLIQSNVDLTLGTEIVELQVRITIFLVLAYIVLLFAYILVLVKVVNKGQLHQSLHKMKTFVMLTIILNLICVIAFAYAKFWKMN